MFYSSSSTAFPHDFHVPPSLSSPFCTVKVLLLSSRPPGGSGICGQGLGGVLWYPPWHLILISSISAWSVLGPSLVPVSPCLINCRVSHTR